MKLAGLGALSWMQLRVRLNRQLRNVCLIFRVFFYGWLQRLWPCTPPGCACTLCLPLKLVLLTVLDLCLLMPDPCLLDPVSLFLTDERSDAAVVQSHGNVALAYVSKLVQDLGLYNSNKELMTEDDFEKTSLETW